MSKCSPVQATVGNLPTTSHIALNCKIKLHKGKTDSGCSDSAIMPYAPDHAEHVSLPGHRDQISICIPVIGLRTASWKNAPSRPRMMTYACLDIMNNAILWLVCQHFHWNAYRPSHIKPLSDMPCYSHASRCSRWTASRVPRDRTLTQCLCTNVSLSVW